MTKRLDPFTRAYIEAALWSTNDESDESGGEPLDANYTVSDIAPSTMVAIVHDCLDFQKRFGALIEDDESPEIEKWGRWKLAGHDFWLTRNDHGAGFGDGNFPKHDAELRKAARSYGNVDLYVSDGVIHAAGHADEVSEAPRRRRVVRDFASIPALIDHARDVDGATHMLIKGHAVKLYYPHSDGKQYQEATPWQERGYWHAPAPGERTVVKRLPPGAESIGSHTRRAGTRTAEAPHVVRDYVAVDPSGRTVAGPFTDYGAAKSAANRARGFVKFAPGRKASEARRSAHHKTR
jgi:hypothetical protein